MKPIQPDKEPSMPKNKRIVNTVVISAASGAGLVLGATAAMFAISYAFRVPRDLKRFIPKAK
jgi:hypothetical protein